MGCHSTTLFIVYINDLNEKMTLTVSKFADDTNISSNIQQELQRDLDTAVDWAHRNETAIYNMDNHRLEEVEEEIRTSSQQQVCSGGQESEADGRTHLQNCETQDRTNCCTTVQSTSETTSGVLLTGLVSGHPI